MFTYANLLMDGIIVEKNKTIAIKYYTELAQKGHPFAQVSWKVLCVGYILT